MKELITKVRDLLEPWRKGTSPLEIRRAILADVESRIVPLGEGKRALPFNHLRVHLLAQSPDERYTLETAIGWDLKDQVANRLAERGCPIPTGLDVELLFDEEPDPRYADRRFFVEFLKRESLPPPSPSSARPTLVLTIAKGEAMEAVYHLDRARVFIGRLEEVVDSDGRILRRNDVAFKADGDINTTVSREHARIVWDDNSRSYWIRAEQNASGTRIHRDGQNIDVSPHDRRGIRLQSGDELLLGRAGVKVTIAQ